MRLEPRFAALTPLETAASAWAVCSRDGLWGAADADGRLFLPCRYEAILLPRPDLWLGRLDGRWGVLDATNGQWRAPPRYSRILVLPEDFGERLLVEREQRWGIIDAANGREILAPRYLRIEPWLEWLAADDAGTVRLFDAAGHPGLFWKGELNGLPPQEQMIDGFGLLRAADGITLIDETGKAAWNDFAEEAGEWNGDWLAVRRMGRWGFADRRGMLVIEPRFEAARSFAGEIAPVREKGRWGLIGRTGDTGVEPTYAAMGIPWNKLVPVAIEGRWGLIDGQGREVQPCLYDVIEWGYDADGKIVRYGVDMSR